MKTYMGVTGDLDEESFLIEANTLEEAREKLLSNLGWYLIETEEDED
jgi:hypothetical protein